MINPDIYIINLNKSQERLAFMSKQLQDINLKFYRVQGIDGSQINAKDLAEYQTNSVQSNLHYQTLNAGEIGCALSWHKTWKLITDNTNNCAIALEDDVLLFDNFISTITPLLNLDNENIIIDLSGKKGSIIAETKIITTDIESIKLIRYQTPPLCNQGAIYGKKALQIFQNKIQNFNAPVDTLQQMLWLHDVQTWSLENGCISHKDDLVGGSVINISKSKINKLNKLKRELLRPLWSGFIIMKNFIYNLGSNSKRKFLS
jgi:glycosyl transferase family 25